MLSALLLTSGCATAPIAASDTALCTGIEGPLDQHAAALRNVTGEAGRAAQQTGVRVIAALDGYCGF